MPLWSAISNAKLQWLQRPIHLAGSRINKAIGAIRRIGNLSERSIYEREDAEGRKIFNALDDAAPEVETRFASPQGKVGAKFALKAVIFPCGTIHESGSLLPCRRLSMDGTPCLQSMAALAG